MAGWTITFTGGTQSGNSALVTGYTFDAANSAAQSAMVLDLTLGSGLTGIPSVTDGFTLTAPLTATTFQVSLPPRNYVGRLLQFLSGADYPYSASIVEYDFNFNYIVLSSALPSVPSLGDSFAVNQDVNATHVAGAAQLVPGEGPGAIAVQGEVFTVEQLAAAPTGPTYNLSAVVPIGDVTPCPGTPAVSQR